MILNSLGLDQEKTKELANDLNILLANFQTYYQNLRGIHWNIKGKRFFDLVDLIAERVLTLGATPFHTFKDYIENAQVPVGKNISQDEKAVNLIVDSLSELLKIERAILNKSGDANDEGTNSMMSDFITEQEKTVWMMKAWLNETV